MNGRTAEINQKISTNIAQKTKGFSAFLNNVFTLGQRNVALKTLATSINTGQLLDPKYEKYLPQSTLSLYKQLKVAVEDGNTLRSLWDNRNPIPLGAGGFGEVYGSSDGKYVFKKMKAIADADDIESEISANKILMSGMQTMQQSSEAFYTQSVDFVTAYKGVFNLEGEDVIVFERAPGSEMGKYLGDNSIRNSNDLTVHSRMCAEFANSIAVTHKAGLVHRDIKPENAMVHVAPDGIVTTKLIDQGEACQNTDKNKLSRRAGTSNFMAPEYLKLPRIISSAVDVYALGITLVNNFFNKAPIQDFVSDGFWKEDNPLSADEVKTINTKIQQYAPGCDIASFNRQNFFEKILANPEKYKPLFDQNNVYSTDQFQFLCGLIRDCVNPDPAARPSAAQVGYCLEFFAACMDDNARIEAHNAKPENRDNQLEKVTIPPYQDIMALAKEDRPVKQEQPA
ncbi:MAG: protein kinase [Puniceicoccales bacterium]|nr:protein kinase [Puniceicoccales bacterium]